MSSQVVETRKKTTLEVDEMYDWFEANSVTYAYLGDCKYLIADAEHATMLKLLWG